MPVDGGTIDKRAGFVQRNGESPPVNQRPKDAWKQKPEGWCLSVLSQGAIVIPAQAGMTEPQNQGLTKHWRPSAIDQIVISFIPTIDFDNRPET
ncbi:MAG: hypothetical protein ACK58T_17185, partial [Phycisphaerae bacterium]